MLKIIVALSLLLFGCHSLNSKDEPPKVIDSSLDTLELVDIALDYDRAVLKKALRALKKKESLELKIWEQEEETNVGNSTHEGIFLRPVFNQVYDLISSKFNDFEEKKLIHLYILFRDLGPQEEEVLSLFNKMITSEQEHVVRVAWVMAEQQPSKSMATAIESRLSHLLKYRRGFSYYIPELAKAVRSNRLKSSYSLMRHGLFETNHLSYAQAMIALRPNKSATDFLDYLALASLEELRQLNVESVDMFVCYEILNHLLTHEISVANKNFRHLFYFAISRNHGFSDLANTIINRYIPEHSEVLAQILAQTNSWVQMAYVERVRRNYTSVSGIILAKLKSVSLHRDVVEEIRGVLN
jgi:hypothetical protein